METSRYVLVLLGEAVESGYAERAGAVLVQHGLDVEGTEVLSGRSPRERRPPPVRPPPGQRRGRVGNRPVPDESGAPEAAGAGEPPRCRALALAAGSAGSASPAVDAARTAVRLRRALRAAFEGAGVDTAVLPADDWRRRRSRLVCLDMDSTLVEAEVIDELARAAGAGEEVAAITDAAMRGEIGFRSAFRARLRRLAGLPVEALEEVAGRLAPTPGAARLLAALHRPGSGCRTAVVSGGFAWFARRFADRLGVRFDHVCAHELVVREGRLTGEIEGEVIDGAAKAAFVRRLAAREGLGLDRVAAAGDGANDVEMLRTVGLGVAFRPRSVLRAEADRVHVIDHFGLDGILYLLGMNDRDIDGA